MHSQPDIQSIGNAYIFSFPDEQIRIMAEKVKETAFGIDGEIVITTSDPDFAENPFIHFSKLNLLSEAQRNSVANAAKKRLPACEWDLILQFVGAHIRYAMAPNSPVQRITANGNGHDPELLQTSTKFQVYPFCIENEQNMLFGKGGSGKSYIACLIGVLAQAGESTCGIKGTQGNVLYLDYESDQNDIKTRVNRLSRGGGLNVQGFYYQRRTTPVPDSLDSIYRSIIENDISLLIIDSVGPACGGSPQKEETAIHYVNSVRSLPVTTLHISHKTKLKDVDNIYPFGSVYWWNMMRNLWEVACVKEEGDDVIYTALYHRKINAGKTLKGRGLRFTFYPDDDGGVGATLVHPGDVSQFAELAKGLSAKEQITAAFKGVKDGKITLKDLVDDTGLNRNTVKSTLARYENSFFGRMVDGGTTKWYLIDQNSLKGD